MTTDSLRQAADALTAIAAITPVENALGATVAVLTTWGFAFFALLAAWAVAAAGGNLRTRMAVVTATGLLATVPAAGIGLGLKRIVAEARPCQVNPAAAEWTTCPTADSFSFPSNHAVFAGALAVVVVVLARLVGRTWIVVSAVVVAVGIAASRVVLGVHYWWDVAAGLAIGSIVTAAALAVMTPLLTAALEHRRQRQHLPV